MEGRKRSGYARLAPLSVQQLLKTAHENGKKQPENVGAA